jgi:hypothetical protein
MPTKGFELPVVVHLFSGPWEEGREVGNRKRAGGGE